MSRERSQQIADADGGSDDMRSVSGTLYVVGVPIGHPDDISLRALRLLGGMDLIASEDPVSTRQLLTYHGIETALTAYGPDNLREKVAVLLHRLRGGARIAIVSDCGSPVISDPGRFLVAAAHAHSIPVMSVPGPSALTAAIAASGLSGDAFVFQGQMPERAGGITQRVHRLVKHSTPTVAFCSRGSAILALDLIAETAPRRIVAAACDLTAPQEIIFTGTARHVRSLLAQRPSTERVTLIVGGRRRRKGPGGKEDSTRSARGE